MRHTGFVPAQRAAEPVAAVAAIWRRIAPFLKRETPTSVRADDSQKKNILQIPQGLYQIRPSESGETGYIQQLHMAGSAMLAGGKPT